MKRRTLPGRLLINAGLVGERSSGPGGKKRKQCEGDLLCTDHYGDGQRTKVELALVPRLAQVLAHADVSRVLLRALHKLLHLPLAGLLLLLLLLVNRPKVNTLKSPFSPQGN